MSGIAPPSGVPLTTQPLANTTVFQPLPLSNQTSDPIKSSIISAADPVPGCFEAFLQVIKDFFESLFCHCFRIPAEKRDAAALPTVPVLALAAIPATPAVIPTPASPTAPAFVRQNTNLHRMTALICAGPIDEKELKDAIKDLSDSFLTKASFDTLWGALALDLATSKQSPDERGNSIVCLKILLENYRRFVKDGMAIPYLTLEIALVSADSPESVSMVIHAMQPNDLISDNFDKAYQLAKTIVLRTGNTAGLEALLEHRTRFTIPFTTYPAAFPYENPRASPRGLIDPNPFIFAFWKVLGKYAPLDAFHPVNDSLANRIIRCIVSLNSELFENNNLKSPLHPDVLLFPDWSRDYLDLIKTILDSKENAILDDRSETALMLSKEIIKWRSRTGALAKQAQEFFRAILVAIAKSGRMNMQHTDAEGHHALIDLAMNEDRESLTQLTLQAPGAFNHHIQLQDVCSMFSLTERMWFRVEDAFPQSFATNPCLRIFCHTFGVTGNERYNVVTFDATRKRTSLQAFIASFELVARKAIIAKVSSAFEAVYPQMIGDLRNMIAHYYPFGLQEEPSDDPSKQTNYLVHQGLPHRPLPRSYIARGRQSGAT